LLDYSLYNYKSKFIQGHRLEDNIKIFYFLNLRKNQI